MATLQRCGTCCRWRPRAEFSITVSETMAKNVPICRPCREKLWDDPDSPDEAR